MSKTDLLFRFCKIGPQNRCIWQKKCWFVCSANLSDFDFFLLNCSSRRAEKDAVMYINSTMDRFRTVGISRFQILLILQIYKDAIDPTSRQEVRFRQIFFQNEVKSALYGGFSFRRG